jgi:hypothetical protein
MAPPVLKIFKFNIHNSSNESPLAKMTGLAWDWLFLIQEVLNWEVLHHSVHFCIEEEEMSAETWKNIF